MKTYTHRIKKYNQNGFSLVEVMVYLSVTILIAGAMVTAFITLNDTLLRNKTGRALTQAANISLERMVRDIRAASSVDTGSSTLNVSPGVLVLESGATTTRYSISGGDLVVSVNGTSIGQLTSDDVVVKSLIFTKYTGSTTDMVRVALQLSASSSAASSTETFYTSAVLRGTYE